MNNLQDFHPRSFDIADKESDSHYYTTHTIPPLIDQGGYKAIEALYHTLIQQKSDTIVDLMCGSNSHIPKDIEYQALIGIDLNENGLVDNSQLTQKIIQDIHQTPILPFSNQTVDYICLCSVVEYLRKPIETFKECHRVLKTGGRIIISFSSHFLPLRATALWQALENTDRQKMIKVLLNRAGFREFDQGEVHPPVDHPVWKDSVYSVVAQKT